MRVDRGYVRSRLHPSLVLLRTLQRLGRRGNGREQDERHQRQRRTDEETPGQFRPIKPPGLLVIPRAATVRATRGLSGRERRDVE